MNPRKRQQRIYLKGGWWYGDFRDYRDVGGRLQALGTQEKDEAEIRAGDRLKELKNLRQGFKVYGHDHRARLGPFAAYHLIEKRRSPRNYGTAYLSDLEHRLLVAVERFGENRNLAEITSPELRHSGTTLRL